MIEHAFGGQAWRVWWGRLRAMTIKELLQLLRDPVLLFVILYGCTFVVYNAGSGVTLQLNHASVAVQDMDHSVASWEPIGRLLPPHFNANLSITRAEEGQRLLDSGGALLAPMQVMLPKVLSMMLLIQAGVPISLVLFFAITTFYIATLSGLGLSIAAVTRNLAQTAMLGSLLLAPIIFLSGVWAPPEAMPPGVRQMMFILPLYYYMDASYGILLKGAGLDVLWPSVPGMPCWAASSVAWGYGTLGVSLIDHMNRIQAAVTTKRHWSAHPTRIHSMNSCIFLVSQIARLRLP